MAEISKLIADELEIAARQNAAKGHAVTIIVQSLVATGKVKSPADIMHLTREVSMLIETFAAEFDINKALQVIADHVAYRKNIPVTMAAGLAENLSPESRLAIYEAWLLIGAKVFAENLLDRMKPKTQIEMATHGNKLQPFDNVTFAP